MIHIKTNILMNYVINCQYEQTRIFLHYCVKLRFCAMLKLLFRISVLLFAFHVGILLNCLHIFKNYRSIPYALFYRFSYTSPSFFFVITLYIVMYSDYMYNNVYRFCVCYIIRIDEHVFDMLYYHISKKGLISLEDLNR